MEILNWINEHTQVSFCIGIFLLVFFVIGLDGIANVIERSKR